MFERIKLDKTLSNQMKFEINDQEYSSGESDSMFEAEFNKLPEFAKNIRAVYLWRRLKEKVIGSVLVKQRYKSYLKQIDYFGVNSLKDT